MMKPIIHRAGTKPEVLFQENDVACRQLRAAIRAVENAAPESRDYYYLGESAVYTAIAEHSGRVYRLREVLRELEALAEHLGQSVGQTVSAGSGG